MCVCVFVYLQVSWIRKRDLHILTAGILTYTSDERFKVRIRNLLIAQPPPLHPFSIPACRAYYMAMGPAGPICKPSQLNCVCISVLLAWPNLYALIKFAQGQPKGVLGLGLGTFAVALTIYLCILRLQVVRTADSKDWTLHVKYAQPRDSGIYECQVNTEPKISMAFRLNVIGELSPNPLPAVPAPRALAL